MTEHRNDEVPLVEVDRLAVTFHTPRGSSYAVREASLQIYPNEVLGLVGESGCGKSTVAFAIMAYLPGTANVTGRVLFRGKDIAELSKSDLRRLRGDRITMVYQDPATSLNPTMRVGQQLEAVLREHRSMDSAQARRRVTELFESVRLPDPEHLGRRYPHELSGGMQQRVMIAMALACDPDLLIMDEPTTGLDVTTEARILDLISELKQRVNAAILFVSHNLGVIARVADRVAVMYAGQIVEQAPVGELFKNPQHPYTTGLLACVPQPPKGDEKVTTLQSIPGSVYAASEANVQACLFSERCPMAQDSCREEAPQMLRAGDSHESRCFFWGDVRPEIWGVATPREESRGDESLKPELSARQLRVFYGKLRRKYILFGPRVDPPVRAVVDVNFDVAPGRTLGIVGESGSGKTTAARTVVGLVPRTGGSIELHGEELASTVETRTRLQRAALRMVFQNPTASLNPKLPIRHAILRSLRKFAGLSRSESRERAAQLLEAVRLDPSYLGRMPKELSGGEQQRVALAGAFAANANIIVADEAVSSLDVSVQAQILNLLREHQREEGTSYIFITHDLGVVRYVSHDILVLYAGHVAESGPAEYVLNLPSHPYTEALLSAAPVPDPEAPPSAIRLEGFVPTLREAFQGCFFAGRCPRKIGAVCDEAPPPTQNGLGSPNHIINCHIPVDQLLEIQQELLSQRGSPSSQNRRTS